MSSNTCEILSQFPHLCCHDLRDVMSPCSVRVQVKYMMGITDIILILLDLNPINEIDVHINGCEVYNPYKYTRPCTYTYSSCKVKRCKLAAILHSHISKEAKREQANLPDNHCLIV